MGRLADMDVAVDPGDSQANEQLWEEYFAGPSEWWDNRARKVPP